MATYKKFTKTERSTFPYWFAHWRAYNNTAMNCKHWRPWYIFHDIEKPFLRIFMDYKKVQKIHRHIASHHIEYIIDYWLHVFNVPQTLHSFQKAALYMMFHFGPDIDGMVIDWECSRFTKAEEPRNAVEEWNVKKDELVPLFNGDKELTKKFIAYLDPLMENSFKRLGLK